MEGLYQLSPSLAVLLVHDLLLSKKGVSAPVSHPLRLAVTRHKARLNAELTKARFRRGFPSLEALEAQLDNGKTRENAKYAQSRSDKVDAFAVQRWAHPRWVRINTIKTTLKEQLGTTFAGYTLVESVQEVLSGLEASQLLHIDKNLPDLVAVPPSFTATSSAAYKVGHIILQDKASCFPAYLLGPPNDGRDCLDACAAPGNKTTHIAAILHNTNFGAKSRSRIFACERDKARATTLEKMVSSAGVENIVEIHPGQDFLRLDPSRPPWANVGSILLDPSCSGSGIIGRDDIPDVILPAEIDQTPEAPSRKRKRRVKEVSVADSVEEVSTQEAIGQSQQILEERLEALAAFQLKIIVHAFRFANASRIVYSTCSIHPQENEHVVMKALQSPVALRRGWRIMQPEEQPSGLQSWPIRGYRPACIEILPTSNDQNFAEKVAGACIRCEKGTVQGTQGFFVAGFVRYDNADVPLANSSESTDVREGQVVASDSRNTESDWEGFDT
jgi:putative methyltransferase